jgi:DNA-binding transcriptional LysR family regulator
MIEPELRTMLQLSDVRVFLAAADSASFTEAALKLRIPKSSVARQLQRLEHELGAQLFTRSTRAVALTDDGRAFLPHAHRLIGDSIEAAHSLRRDAASGLLTITAPVTFARHFLAPHLGAFRKRFPDVRLALDLSPRKLDVGLGEADIAIRLGPAMGHGLGLRPLGQIVFVLVATQDYLRANPAILNPFDLAAHAVIELRPPLADHSLELASNGSTQRVRVVPSIEANDPETVKTLCLSHLGIAALPRFLVSDDLRSGALIQLLPQWRIPAANVNAIYDRRHALPVRVRVCLDFLAEISGVLARS